MPGRSADASACRSVAAGREPDQEKFSVLWGNVLPHNLLKNRRRRRRDRGRPEPETNPRIRASRRRPVLISSRPLA